MIPAGVEKAEDRLRKAEAALKRVEIAQMYEEFAAAWSDFVTLCATIFSVLETASKDNPKCKTWFGTCNNERTADPLLSYMKQTRHVEEHGIEPVTQQEVGFIKFLGNSHIQNMKVAQSGSLRLLTATVTIPPGAELQLHMKPSSAKLVSVANPKYGDTFEVPTMHLGQPLSDCSPANVAKLCFTFHQRVVGEARARC
jgi:hypothetical protein